MVSLILMGWLMGRVVLVIIVVGLHVGGWRTVVSLTWLLRPVLRLVILIVFWFGYVVGWILRG